MVEFQTLFVQNIPPRYHWSGLRQLFVKEAWYRAKSLSGNLNSPLNSNIVKRAPKDISSAEEDSETHISRRRGLGDVKTKFLGGRDFLIEIVDDELYRASERVTWIKLIGVPLHCWNHNTFKRIAEQWGEFLALGENALQELGCEEMTILIATSRKDLIDEVVDLEVGRDVFKVRIVEQSTNRSESSCRKQEAKANLATVDSSSSTGRSTDSSEEKNSVRWQEEDDSHLVCIGNITKGDFLSGMDEEERNIGEEAILGQRVNALSFREIQKQCALVEVHEGEVAQDDIMILIQAVGAKDGRNDILKDLSIWEGSLGSKAVEDTDFMGLTNSSPKNDPMMILKESPNPLSSSCNQRGGAQMRILSWYTRGGGIFQDSTCRQWMKFLSFCYKFRWSESIALAWFVSFVAALWSLWLARNDLVFRSKGVFSALDENFWWDWPGESSSSIAHQCPKSAWQPPASGQLKFNVDGSAMDKTPCCGGVFRTLDGYVVAMSFGPGTKVNSDYAELLAIKIALDVYIDSCWCCKAALIVESDSKVVLNWIQNAYSRPWRLGVIFQEIDVNTLKISEIRFVFSPRTTNNMEDYLAKMGSTRKFLFKASW
ncbi:hypothetical protein F3Y22_tig00113725pilonHSYRG01912 [Hibiscus syriacus]|uniref:RNase H type-1 domain-containing protein n=1 Tax=Hibiscus syriacus TaxID=106335 RepID=A0A6A2WPJ4_HIBSY|nr:hypothetical protein F3Y22_tig00113725pilonHSYRG01912 [Hibiscus syriacus]